MYFHDGFSENPICCLRSEDKKIAFASVHCEGPFEVFRNCFWFITGRNEVVAKVMFLHVSVILLTGGVGGLRRTPLAGRTPRDQAEPPGRENPPGPGRTPPGPGRTPLGPGRTPPGPGRTPQQGEPPQDQAPPRPGRHPPPGEKTAAYGQWAAGTHPTGMHSCFVNFFGYIKSAPPPTSSQIHNQN